MVYFLPLSGILGKIIFKLRNIIQSLYCIGFWDHLISKLVFKKPRPFSIFPDGCAMQLVYNVYLWYLGYITLVITIYVHLFLLNRFYSSLGHPLCNLVLNKFSWISKIDFKTILFLWRTHFFNKGFRFNSIVIWK